jgi:hypothetical protein
MVFVKGMGDEMQHRHPSISPETKLTPVCSRAWVSLRASNNQPPASEASSTSPQ